MNAEEVYARRVEELMDGIDKGEFSDIANPPQAYSYGHLAALFYFAQVLQNGKKLYEQLYDRVISFGTYHVRKKVENGEKIKIAFLAISAAEWARAYSTRSRTSARDGKRQGECLILWCMPHPGIIRCRKHFGSNVFLCV